MPQFEVGGKEWLIAHPYLDNASLKQTKAGHAFVKKVVQSKSSIHPIVYFSLFCKDCK
ncbi:hypothetical protein Lsan_2731 [Legionella santicrucis]|uniref:Uncharacterized protein n=1 Tax=Legionella santicrucis TaxID=45074 RepID=A0A0W0YIC4_9GAMM|nr:hypothetical protein [Legionella santicrucis]KTD56571.1 hypothetical protein Lsan_2731 [Legionella santicrucis]